MYVCCEMNVMECEQVYLVNWFKRRGFCGLFEWMASIVRDSKGEKNVVDRKEQQQQQKKLWIIWK